MKNTRALALILSLCLPGLAMAEPVDENQVTTFQAGQPACAADVNQTIQALIAAVNDNAARVAQLEAQLVALTNPVESLQDKISSCEFQVFSFQDVYGSGTETLVTPAENKTEKWVNTVREKFVQIGVLDLSPDGSFTLTTTENEHQTLLTTYALDSIDVESPIGPPYTTNTDISYFFADTDTGTDPGTWTLTGQMLTLTFPPEDGDPEEQETLMLTPDGSMLMSWSAETGVPAGPAGTVVHSMGALFGICIATPQIKVEEVDVNGEIVAVLSHPADVGNSFFTSTYIRVSNVGQAPLTGLDLVASGTAFISVPLSTTTLGPSQSVVFAAQETSSGAGKLELSSNDSDTPVFEINFP